VETSTPTVPVSSLLNSQLNDTVARAEKEVSSSLDQLEARGVLQQRNRMDLEELLNPASEQELVSKVSEEEIFKSI